MSSEGSADRSLQGLGADSRQVAEEVLAEWRCPGLALGLITEKGPVTVSLGHADLDAQIEVQPDTIFALGSATKAFTALGVALLIDRGALDWDQPIRNYLTDYRMADPFATERMTARDLLTHRSGLPRHDLVWYRSPLSRREIMNRLQYLEPTRDFRTAFQYQNLMYMTAGCLIEEITGTTWEDFTTNEIAKPLGLAHTTCFAPEQDGGAARPYAKANGKFVSDEPLLLGAIAPAGSVWSTVEDMLRWVGFQMTGMDGNGAPLISDRILGELTSPQVLLGRAGDIASILTPLDEAEEVSYSTYGMGWFIHGYRGRKLVHHGGFVDGFSSYVAYVPQERLGVVVLCNCNESPVPIVTSLSIIDRVLGYRSANWVERMKRVMPPDVRGQAAIPPGSEEELPAASSVSSDEFVGNYFNPGYGKLLVTADEYGLVGDYHGIALRMSHLAHDIFQLDPDATPLTTVPWPRRIAFVRDLEGTVVGLQIVMETACSAIHFRRRAP